MEWLLNKDNPVQLQFVPLAGGPASNSALRHHELRSATHASLPERVRTDRVASLHDGLYGMAGCCLCMVRGDCTSGKRERFAFGVLVTGFLAIAVLHVHSIRTTSLRALTSRERLPKPEL